jgi:hypothetical protein
MLTPAPLTVDTGCLRLRLPSTAADATEYEFKRDAQRIVVAPLYLEPDAGLGTVAETRLRQIMDASRGVDPTATFSRSPDVQTTLPDSSAGAILHVATSGTMLHFGVVAARSEDKRSVVLSFASVRSEAMPETEQFEEMFRAIVATTTFAAPPIVPDGWRARRLGRVGLALPRDFICPERFAFTTPEWTILITQGDHPRPWRPYFGTGTQTSVIKRTTVSVSVGSPPHAVEQETQLVRCIQTRVGPDGGVTQDPASEHISHALTAFVGTRHAAHLFGVTTPEHRAMFEHDWAAFLSAVERVSSTEIP